MSIYSFSVAVFLYEYIFLVSICIHARMNTHVHTQKLIYMSDYIKIYNEREIMVRVTKTNISVLVWVVEYY